jgi:hypothetical protein
MYQEVIANVTKHLLEMFLKTFYESFGISHLLFRDFLLPLPSGWRRRSISEINEKNNS